MDRRSIFFIIGMTAIFFLMNQWFEYGKRETEEIAEPKTTVEFLNNRLPRRLSQAEMKQLQVVRLYRDIELKEFLSFAIDREDNFLTIAGDGITFPKELYVQGIDPNDQSIDRIELRVPPKKPGDPVLYSRFPLSKLTIPWIPEEDEYNVQMIFFERDEVRSIEGTSFGMNRAVFDATPGRNALVLFEFNKTSSPYAYFELGTRTMSSFSDLPAFKNFTFLTFPTKEAQGIEGKDEKFYLLENEFFQLVFSSYNGALAEINLPFHSTTHPKSVVREIGFDREMEADYTDNDLFPLYPSLAAEASGKTREVLPKPGGYYPLIRRDLIGVSGDTTIEVNPHYYATTVFEKDIFPFIQEFTLTRLEKDLIEFQFSDETRKITKTYSIPKEGDLAPYCLNLSVNIEGDARRLVIGTGIPEVELVSGSFNPTLKYRQNSLAKSTVERIKIPKTFTELPHVEADWVCNSNGFFGIILDPLNRQTKGLGAFPISGELAPTRLSVIDAQYQSYPSSKYPGYAMQIPLLARPGKTDYRLFLGPFDKKILRQVDQTFSDPAIGYNPDYRGAQSYHGWFAFISQPFAKFLFVIMDFFHTITGSWGISIILLTAVLRLMLYPLNNWSMRSTAKMQKLSPKVKALQDKYKKDPKRMQMETMNLYRKERANPFGGCLPILIQLPFLLGMFDLLKSSFELRGATFIPGWINNLAAPDTLFTWGYPIPFIGTSFHLLPILLGASMFFQQRMMSAKNGSTTDQQKQQRSMANIMTIVFTVMFYHFPSGLNLYWISSTLLGILQQWLVNKKINTPKG